MWVACSTRHGTLVGVGSQSLVQIRVEDRLLGCVMNLWTPVAMSSPAIGHLVGGAMMRQFGPHGDHNDICKLIRPDVPRGRHTQPVGSIVNRLLVQTSVAVARLRPKHAYDGIVVVKHKVL